MDKYSDLEKILQKLISLSIEAGELAKSIKEKKEYADEEIENFIRNNLKNFNYSFIGEETKPFLSQDSNRCFVVDPIDGSLNYQNGDENWCVSIALMENNEPILGVVFVPERHMVFYAQKTKGAKIIDCQQHSERNLVIEKEANLIELLGTSNNSTEIRDTLLNTVLNKNYIRFRHTGSIVIASLKLIMGARGIIYGGKTHLHDIAAVWLILKESGGEALFNKEKGLFIATQNRETMKKLERFYL